MSDADLLLIQSAFREIERHLRAQVDCPQLREWRRAMTNYERVVEGWGTVKPTPPQSDAVLEATMDLLLEVGKAATLQTAPPPPATLTAAPPGFARSEMPAAVARGAELQAQMREQLPDGVRIEIGEPTRIELLGGEPMWVCLAKIRKCPPLRSDPPPPWGPPRINPVEADAEVTETVFLATGTGKNQDEAIRDAEQKVIGYSKGSSQRKKR